MLVLANSVREAVVQPHLIRMRNKRTQIYWQNPCKCNYRDKSKNRFPLLCGRKKELKQDAAMAGTAAP